MANALSRLISAGRGWQDNIAGLVLRAQGRPQRPPLPLRFSVILPYMYSRMISRLAAVGAMNSMEVRPEASLPRILPVTFRECFASGMLNSRVSTSPTAAGPEPSSAMPPSLMFTLVELNR